MSHKAIDELREYRFENDLCQICGKKLDWPAISANMAIRNGRNDICKECRRKEPILKNNPNALCQSQ